MPVSIVLSCHFPEQRMNSKGSSSEKLPFSFTKSTSSHLNISRKTFSLLCHQVYALMLVLISLWTVMD